MSEINKAVKSKYSGQASAAIVSFRRAIANDRAFLLQLRKASMTEHLNSADEYFSDSHIISYQNVAIGLLKLGQFPDKIHLRQFQLLPEYHGLGIGSRVLKLIQRKAQERQLSITLNVLLDNPAKQLYLKHGFVISTENELEFAMRWPG